MHEPECPSQDRLGKFGELLETLKAKIERLTVENAGLRAHNASMLDAESAGSADTRQASALLSTCWSWQQSCLLLGHHMVLRLLSDSQGIELLCKRAEPSLRLLSAIKQ